MKKIPFLLLVGFTALLASCKMPAAQQSTATVTMDPQAEFTSAVATALAKSLEESGDLSNLSPEDLIRTRIAPTATFIPQGTIQTTTIDPETSATGEAPEEPLEPVDDVASFLADISVPDDTIFKPGESFKKTWQLMNSGQTTWNRNYQLVFAGGELMSGPPNLFLQDEVGPGDVVDLSVGFIAPQAAGTYKGNWKLKNDQGQLFGVGPSQQEAFWVQIKVEGQGSGETAPPPGQANNAPKSISLTLDEEEVKTDCPYTMDFIGQFTLDQPSALTYMLEIIAPTAPFEVEVPRPVTRQMNAGTHQVVFEMNFTNDLEGVARLVFLEPEGYESSLQPFKLTCR